MRKLFYYKLNGNEGIKKEKIICCVYGVINALLSFNVM